MFNPGNCFWEIRVHLAGYRKMLHLKWTLNQMSKWQLIIEFEKYARNYECSLRQPVIFPHYYITHEVKITKHYFYFIQNLLFFVQNKFTSLTKIWFISKNICKIASTSTLKYYFNKKILKKCFEMIFDLSWKMERVSTAIKTLYLESI